MKKVSLSFIALILILRSMGQHSKDPNEQFLSPSNDLLLRTYWIVTGKSSGTCFYISNLNGNYLVTVRHLFSGKKSGERIAFAIFIGSRFITGESTIRFHQNDSIDLAVIPVSENLRMEMGFPKDGLSLANDEQISLGQPLIFLGFPTAAKSFANMGLLPLVKHSIFSGVTTKNDGTSIMLLDGHNNKGFSGGPVFGNNTKSLNGFFVIGVINGYFNETGSTENSGIIAVTPRQFILEILDGLKSN